MNKEETTIIYYELVNRLYSLNYSSLRFYEQGKSQFSAENFKFKMPYQNKQTWLEAKIEDVNNWREELFLEYREANKQSGDIFINLERNLEKSKEDLIYICNYLLNGNYSIEDLFDGFRCRDPELLELLQIFELKPFEAKDRVVYFFADAYSKYISNLYYKTITQAMFDIVEQLRHDFNSNGTPSFYKGIIQKESIKRMSDEELKKMRQRAKDLSKQLKSIKTEKHSGYAYTHAMSTNKYYELDLMIEQLEKRLKSANKDFVNTISNKIVERTMDFLTGTSNGQTQRPVVNEIYVTELELSYLEYLFGMLEHGIEYLKQSKIQKEEQKGESQ